MSQISQIKKIYHAAIYGFKTKEKSEWTSVMVRRILTNEIYIGNLVQGKQTTPNHKVKKTIIKEV